jgi:hypothetical protein
LGLTGAGTSTGAGQVPNREQISPLDRISFNKGCGIPMPCIAGCPLGDLRGFIPSPDHEAPPFGS